MSVQLMHDEVINTKKNFPIVLLLGGVRTPQNIGMCFRVAEAFGVQKIYLHPDSPSVKNKVVHRTARNTENFVTFAIAKNQLDTLLEYKKNGYVVICLEVTNTSKALHKYSFDPDKKYLFIVGSERFGVEKSLMEHSDACVHVTMYGTNSSMNVVTSLSTLLYEITKQISK